MRSNKYDPKDETAKPEPYVWHITLLLQKGLADIHSVEHLHIVESQRHNLGFLVQGRVDELAEKHLRGRK